MPLTTSVYIAYDTGYGSTADSTQGDPYQSILVLQNFTPEILSPPGGLTVSVEGGLPDLDFIFRIDGHEVIRLEADENGALEVVTVPVPDLRGAAGNSLLLPGTHTVQVLQGLAQASTTFEVTTAPPKIPQGVAEDAPPIYVVGSVQPTGVRRWVLQDLAPGGLGSWVMPMNPVDADSPPFSRELTSLSTVADVEKGGQYHVYEDAFSPVDWTVRGYCPTEEMLDKLEAYADLNRRFYLIDHRGRAWKVTFRAFEPTPRLAQIWNGDWNLVGHDYSATFIVTERDYVEV